MKKLTYLLVAATALGMAACGESKSGYVISGTVEGAADGEAVYLQEMSDWKINNLDTAIIKNGTFTFEGMQDSTVSRMLSWSKEDNATRISFFLENGNIKVDLMKDQPSATGTPNNDIYQEIRVKADVINKKADAIFQVMADVSLTDKQREANSVVLNELQNELNQLYKEAIKKNITNAVGVELFCQNYYYLTSDENAAFLEKLPAKYLNNAIIGTVKEIVSKQKATAPGAKFVDFELNTPDGKRAKLSDYAGKGKVVLIDFWASWCGPCRQEMPNITDAYAKYKNKNFEIVGVSLDQDGTAWKESIKSLNMTWPQLSDLKSWNSEAAQLYAINGIPHTVLIDADGTILARGLHGKELQKVLAEKVK